MSTKGLLCAGLGMIIAMTITALLMANDLKKIEAAPAPQQGLQSSSEQLAEPTTSLPATDQLPAQDGAGDRNLPETAPESADAGPTSDSAQLSHNAAIVALQDAELVLADCPGNGGYTDCAAMFADPIVVDRVSTDSIKLVAKSPTDVTIYRLSVSTDREPCRSTSEEPSSCSAW